MIETQKKALWQIAEVFRGTKGSGNINDIAREAINSELKPLIKEEYQNTNFAKNVDLKWHCTAQDNSVEYVEGSFEIDTEKLASNENLFFTNSVHIDYSDGRYIFLDVRDFPATDENATVKKFNCYGGIRYFKDGYVSPVTLAEQHIENFFSVAQLLQMKIWWDEIPHASTPKLAAVYQWTADTTNAAITGSTTFTTTPFTFEEITQEIASLS